MRFPEASGDVRVIAVHHGQHQAALWVPLEAKEAQALTAAEVSPISQRVIYGELVCRSVVDSSPLLTLHLVDKGGERIVAFAVSLSCGGSSARSTAPTPFVTESRSNFFRYSS